MSGRRSRRGNIPPKVSTGIVLSGGGARGAYEAGVVAGIMEVLRPERSVFDVLCGTSVGALNAAYLASHAHLPDMNAPGLISQWQALDLDRHLQLDLRGLLGWEPNARPSFSLLRKAKRESSHFAGRSILSASAIDDLVTNAVRWSCLHDNVRRGVVRALIVAALHINTGKTTLFAEMAPGLQYKGGQDPRRTPYVGEIGREHVLASAAIPLLFPARRVGSDYYCDGGVRFNTPIAPAIRAGARRLVVVSLLSEGNAASGELPEADRLQAYANPIFLIGKVLNALFLDPLNYDLQILERFNRLLDVLESTLTRHELARVHKVLEESRGISYRRVEALVFRPSQDLGRIARLRAEQLKSSMFSSFVLARVAKLGALWESDLLSFVLFDPEFARQLVQLGRRDALARAAEIRTFFHKDHEEHHGAGAA